MRPDEWVRAAGDGARNIGAWARDYGYCGVELSRGAISWLTREDPASWQKTEDNGEPRLPALLIPGIFETWRMMRPVARALREAGHPVHVVPQISLNSKSMLIQTRRVVRFLRSNPGDFAIVAHSKGGLVGKSVMLVPGVGERIPVMVTIATPFAGSSLASFWAPGLGIRALAPSSRQVRALHGHAAVNARIVALIPRWDPHIPDDSTLDGATNIHIKARGHFAPLGEDEVHREVLRALAAVEASRAQGVAKTDNGGETGQPREAGGGV